jgi:hypothetical protein
MKTQTQDPAPFVLPIRLAVSFAGSEPQSSSEPPAAQTIEQTSPRSEPVIPDGLFRVLIVSRSEKDPRLAIIEETQVEPMPGKRALKFCQRFNARELAKPIGEWLVAERVPDAEGEAEESDGDDTAADAGEFHLIVTTEDGRDYVATAALPKLMAEAMLDGFNGVDDGRRLSARLMPAFKRSEGIANKPEQSPTATRQRPRPTPRRSKATRKTRKASRGRVAHSTKGGAA